MSIIQTTYLLGFDCESSGMAFSNAVDPMCPDPSYNYITKQKYQSVSWGLIVIDVKTTTIIDELYVEIKPQEGYEWNNAAERTHGLSREYLEEHGLYYEDAVLKIAEFILKYWDMNKAISTFGHNQVTFDHWFFRRLMHSCGLHFKFANRHIDTNYLTNGIYDVEGSEELFQLFSSKRGEHNALEDIKQTFEIFKQTKKLFQTILGT